MVLSGTVARASSTPHGNQHNVITSK